MAVQGLRICLVMQGTQFRSLVHMPAATEPVHDSCSTHAPQQGSHGPPPRPTQPKTKYMFLEKETEACHGPPPGWQTLAQGPACQMNKRSLGAGKGATQGTQPARGEAKATRGGLRLQQAGHATSHTATPSASKQASAESDSQPPPRVFFHTLMHVPRGGVQQLRDGTQRVSQRCGQDRALPPDSQDAPPPAPPVTHQPSDLKGAQRRRPRPQSHRPTSPHTASPRTTPT